MGDPEANGAAEVKPKKEDSHTERREHFVESQGLTSAGASQGGGLDKNGGACKHRPRLSPGLFPLVPWYHARSWVRREGTPHVGGQCPWPGVFCAGPDAGPFLGQGGTPVRLVPSATRRQRQSQLGAAAAAAAAAVYQHRRQPPSPPVPCRGRKAAGGMGQERAAGEEHAQVAGLPEAP